jgi:hypothetical protein
MIAELNLDSARIDGTMHVQGAEAEFSRIVLTGAQVGHVLSMETHSRITSLEAENFHIGQNGTLVSDIESMDLRGAKVDGELSNVAASLSVSGATFDCLDLSEA